jgi:predicted ATPase
MRENAMPAAAYNEDLLGKYPQPLAGAYARFIDERDPAAQHALLLALFEALLKYLAAAALGQYRARGGSDPAVEGSLPALRHPSLGHWAGLLRQLLAWQRQTGHPAAEFVFPELPTLYHKPATQLEAGAAWLRAVQGGSGTKASLRQVFDSLVEYRNAQAHGAGQGTAHYAKLVPLLQATLEEVLWTLPSLAGHPLGYMESISVGRGEAQTLTLLRLMSDRPRLRPQQIALAAGAAHPEPQQLYVLRGDNLAGTVPLHPLLVFIPACDVCQEAQVGVLNGVNTNAADYLCYGCGHPNQLAGLLPDLAAFVPPGAGVPTPTVLPAEEPAEAAPSPTPPHNLPPQPTAFIGRERAIAAVEALLRRPAVHLVTLTGPGGTGKTRLALEVAAQAISDFPDGAWLVDLAPLTEPGLVAQTIAGVLGVKEATGQPLLETLNFALGEKQMLLVLDNFEQVVDAAPMVTGLLKAAPNLKVLATSRIPLHIYGEKEFAVPPLALPDPQHLPPLDQLSQYEAVRLFIERAQDVRADFQVTNENAPAVAEICARLDGLPLAIELAAARVRLFKPQALLERLGSRLKLLTGGPRDHATRQQTLRGTIAWSYDLLPPGEQQLFRRLAVFPARRTLEAIAAICGGGEESDGLAEWAPAPPALTPLAVDVLEGVESLVSKSLLQQRAGADGEPRCTMLETICEYACEKMEESGEAEALAARHLAYFLSQAEQAEPHLWEPQQRAWLDRLADDLDNDRAALAWAAAGAAESGLRLAAALWRFWDVRGYYTEGREHLAALLAAAPASAPGRAAALAADGLLAERLGDYAAAQAALEASAALAGEQGQEAVRVRARYGLGRVAWERGAYGEAQEHLAASLAGYRALGDRAGIATALHNLGGVAFARGEREQFRVLTEEALAIRRALGDTAGIITSSNNLAYYWRTVGELAQARAIAAETLALAQEFGEKSEIAHSLAILGAVALDEGDLAGARRYHTEALALFRDVGLRRFQTDVLLGLFLEALWQGDVAGARAYAEEQLTFARQLDTPHRSAGSRIWLAYAPAWAGEYAVAGALLAEVRALGEAGAEAEGLVWTRYVQALLAHWRGAQPGSAEEVEAAIAWFREHGTRPVLTEPLYWRGRMALAAGEVAAARRWLGESLALAGVLGRRLFAAWGLAAFAEVAAAEETDGARVGRLAGAAAGRLAATTGRLWPVEEAAHAAMLARVRPTVDPAVWEAAWAEGQAMPLEQAIAYALGP